MPRRYLAVSAAESHNAEMDVVTVFLDFLQRIAVGACAVFAILLAIWVVLPRSSRIEGSRRTAN
jgi:hypothetical protein